MAISGINTTQNLNMLQVMQSTPFITRVNVLTAQDTPSDHHIMHSVTLLARESIMHGQTCLWSSQQAMLAMHAVAQHVLGRRGCR